MTTTRLPTFLIIGTMKGGTTSLFEYLRIHPEVAMAEDKEVHYFTRGDWETPAVRQWYEAMFAGPRAQRARARGEASPGYSRYPQAPETPERIAALIPDVRLIYLLRHPVQRIVSQYRHKVSLGTETRPIDEAVVDEHEYVGTSRYACQIERYLEHFDRDQILTLRSEDLREERAETLATVLRFIGVDDRWQAPNLDQDFNAVGGLRGPRRTARQLREWPRYQTVRPYLPKRLRVAANRVGSRAAATLPPGSDRMRSATHRTLIETLQPDLERLRRLAGPGFDAWGLLDAPAVDA